MKIDNEGIWHCSNCEFIGSYDVVKKHEDAVKLAREYFKGKAIKCDVKNATP